MKRVLIRGGGIAACCCEHLLRKAGIAVRREERARPRLPTILLSDLAIALLRDVFEQPALFRNCHRIEKRVVAWGQGTEAVELAHSGVVVSEEELLQAVALGPGESGDGTVDWTVVTARPLPAGASEHGFGTRVARAVEVSLHGSADTCWIESLDGGWLFLIPNRERKGWLLAVGNAPDVLLAESRLVAGRIAETLPGTGEFAAFPRIMTPLSDNDWVACGSGAMAFDPLCGDGTANAVREAILASALITAAFRGGDVAALTRHYDARLTAGFARHLSLSLSFYETGGTGRWWREEAKALREGLRWCTERSAGFTGYQYQLRGFELVPVLP